MRQICPSPPGEIFTCRGDRSSSQFGLDQLHHRRIELLYFFFFSNQPHRLCWPRLRRHFRCDPIAASCHTFHLPWYPLVCVWNLVLVSVLRPFLPLSLGTIEADWRFILGLRGNILNVYYEDKATPKQRTYASAVSGGISGGIVTRLMGELNLSLLLDGRSIIVSCFSANDVYQVAGLFPVWLFSLCWGMLDRPRTMLLIDGSWGRRRRRPSRSLTAWPSQNGFRSSRSLMTSTGGFWARSC